jgi:protein-disulfide isomerase
MPDDIGEHEHTSHREPEPGADGTPERADARRVRRARLTRLAIVVALVAAAIVAVLVTTGPSSPPRPGSPAANATDHEIGLLLADVPQHANTLGQSTAPITLKWYGDLECPYCKEFTLGALPSIIGRWVRGGQLKIEYLSMETATREPKVFQTQQVAALAAGMQDKLWNYIETFYHEQGEEDSGYVTERYLQGLARQIPGLNIDLWTEDRFDPELASEVVAERQSARKAHFHSTPTFLIDRDGGKSYRIKPRSLTQPHLFNEAIEYLLGT